MQLLTEILPDFAKQVENNLRSAANVDLADQIASVRILRWTYEVAEDAGFIYLEPARPSNIAERNVIKPFYSHSVELEDLPGMVVVDVDNLGRVTGIELLNRADIFDELAKKLPVSR
jgi:uncharacterized protein YuzE